MKTRRTLAYGYANRWSKPPLAFNSDRAAQVERSPGAHFQLITGRIWKGTAFGGARDRADVPKIVDWYMQGKINIDDLITHTIPLEEINAAFDLVHEGKSIRSIVLY